jgi:hypothetical protein
MLSLRTLLLALLLLTPYSHVFAQLPGSWPSAPGQTQQSDWPSPDRYHDPYRRAYGYSGPDYACPQPSVVVRVQGVQLDNLSAPTSRQWESDQANREITSAAEASRAMTAPENPDSVPAQAVDANPPSARPYAILTCGTFVRLEFAAPVSSKTAKVGERLTLRLTEDIKVGNTVIVPRGTLAGGHVTFVRRTAPGGIPGTLAYQLNALQVNGTSVPLWLVEERSGDPKVLGAQALIPVAGPFTLLRHGKDLELQPGMPVTAFIAADTTLPLPQSLNVRKSEGGRSNDDTRTPDRQ